MNNNPVSDPFPPQKKPWLALLLTFIFPGLGHLYLGNRFSAIAYGLIGIGLGISYFSAHSFLGRAAILFIIPFVMLPAARDAVSIAQGKKKNVTGEESPLYVIWMLCCVGPFAIPLLWQNKKFSITAKTIWTVVVVSIVVIFLFAVGALGKSYDSLTQVLSG